MYRRLLLVLALGVIGGSSRPADANHAYRATSVQWRIAGTLITDVKLVAPDTGMESQATLIHVRAKGSPGSAEIRALSTVVPIGGCDNGVLFSFASNDFVATLSDLSLIFAELDEGKLCVTFDGITRADIGMLVTGGTGRFEGAEGHLTLRVTTRPVRGGSFLSGETGTVTGMIRWPR